VSVLDRIKVLRSGRSAIGLAKAVSSRRVADARAGIDVVVAKARADELLDEERLFIRAPRRRDAANAIAAILFLDALELGGGIADRLVRRHFAPGVRDLLANHRFQDAFLVRGVRPCKAPLHAGVATVRLTVLVGHHAHELFAAHLGLKGAADA